MVPGSSLVLVSVTVKVSKERETQPHLHRYYHWSQNVLLEFSLGWSGEQEVCGVENSVEEGVRVSLS